jgi:iron(III) transport system ATP-binding protein
MWIELRRIEHEFNNVRNLRGVSLRLEQGDIGCLVGPSGAGKTSVLRCIAGFEPLCGGEILANDLVLSRSGLTVAPERRGFGMVFQDYALLPHLNVLENVLFGLHGRPRSERRARALEVIDIVGLGDVLGSYPRELSGGQQQRVALARSLAPQPRLLLLDEPFSNLDVELRQHLSTEVRTILKTLGTTAMMVTHDQREAFAIADRVGVMRGGLLEQWDTPYNLYHAPTSRFVAEFIGQGVFVPGKLTGAGNVVVELGELTGCPARGFSSGAEVDVLLRPDDIVHDADSRLRAEVRAKSFRGSDILYSLYLESGSHVLASVPSHHDYNVGERIGIRLNAKHVVMFPRMSETRSRRQTGEKQRHI